MECNKDEADRSKSIAEAKFLQHDFVGAKKFALKARQLFPELDGLPQFISALEVHTAAHETLPGGERNWYAILQIDPTADESTIRKQYRRLALLLHPDKNKSVGAEAAFKYISEAWGTLSDKAKKAAYDTRRNSKATQSWKMAQYTEPASRSNGYHDMSRPSTASQPQPRQQPQPRHQPQPQPAPMRPTPTPPPNLQTFWTACPSCKMQFEYQSVYKNSTLCCPICHKPFFAREVTAVSGTTLWPHHSYQGFKTEAPNDSSHGVKSSSSANGNFPWSPFGNAAAPNVVHSQVSGRPSKENADVQQRKEVGRKEQKKGERKKGKDQMKAKAAAQAKEAFDRLIARSKVVIEQKLSSEKAAASERKAGVDNPTTFGHAWCDISSGTQERTAASRSATAGKPTTMKVEEKENIFVHENENIHQAAHTSPGGKRNNPVEPEVQDDAFPAKKQRTDPNVSLDEQASDGGIRRRFGDLNPSNTEERGNVKDVEGHDFFREREILKASMDVGGTGKTGVTTGNSLQEKHSLPVAADAISVPDSEFYDFDKDRTEYHFSVGQIWSAYDDDDGMPRYYARVSKVISFQPFKIQMSWLEARCPSDETLAWLDSGFSYTCGEFKLGQTTTSEFINTFSHLMTFEKGQRGGFKIYPRKGDIWALYKSWNTLKNKDAEIGYDISEVLTDFSEEEGVQISLLVKVEEFKTLFRRQLGQEYVQQITPAELRIFSHQVPAHRLPVEEALGIREGCWELDPASTPTALITGKQGE